jgi:hypothetical protein
MGEDAIRVQGQLAQQGVFGPREWHALAAHVDHAAGKVKL